MELSGPWLAHAADDELRRTWLDEVDEDTWEPIEVPGHWRSTPAFAEVDGPLLHRTRFEAERPLGDERAWLVLDGCFYQGDVWLDGAYVGDTEGWFFPHAFEVTEALAGRTEHTLGIELTCSPPSNRRAKRNLTGVFQHWDRLDPDLNPGGIWRPVRIERSGPVRIRHLRVLCCRASPEQAVLGVRGVLDAAEAGAVTVRTTVAGIDHTETHTLAAGENQLSWSVTIPRPALWWPRALGAQPLHEVVVEVLVPPTGDGASSATPEAGDDRPALGDGPGDQATVVSDRRVRRTGLRQVELHDWVASVNGERLFLKGAAVGPTRQALAEATPEEVRGDVAAAVDVGLDLLRVHAHVARPELYEAADEAGVLLWQDMPLQWGYSRMVRKQAVRQARELVDLLGHHPSIALWCGHDEPLALDVEPGLGHRPASGGRAVLAQQLPSWNKTVLDRSIKRTLERHDGTRPVIAHSGVVPHPPALDGTDGHLSFGWAQGDERDLPGFARLLPRLVRFVSGFGPQAVPDSDEFLEPERWPDLDWEKLAHTHGLQRQRFDRHVRPAEHATYTSWKAATQDYQASVVKRQVEELRRLKYRPTGGFAHSYLADGHPAVSTSLLDHQRRPKPAFDALRAACAPVIVVVDRLPAHVRPGDALALDVHVVNDRRTAVEGAQATVRVGWPGGEHTWRFTGDVEADGCALVDTLQLVVPDARGPLFLDVRLTAVDGTEIAANHDATVIER